MCACVRDRERGAKSDYRQTQVESTLTCAREGKDLSGLYVDGEDAVGARGVVVGGRHAHDAVGVAHEQEVQRVVHAGETNEQTNKQTNKQTNATATGGNG